MYECTENMVGSLALFGRVYYCRSIQSCECIRMKSSYYPQSLKDCTLGMDANTWNAYHLITNRAKAVCAAIRQDQFRGLAEITVNKLMQSGTYITRNQMNECFSKSLINYIFL